MITALASLFIVFGIFVLLGVGAKQVTLYDPERIDRAKP